MNKSDLLFGNTLCDQLLLYVIIDIERAVILRSGVIAEYKLCATNIGSVSPDFEYIVDTSIYLASRLVGTIGIDKSLVKTDFPSVSRAFRHIIG